jgi:hypothetical protein
VTDLLVAGSQGRPVDTANLVQVNPALHDSIAPRWLRGSDGRNHRRSNHAGAGTHRSIIQIFRRLHTAVRRLDSTSEIKKGH